MSKSLSHKQLAQAALAFASNPQLLEVARLAIEDELIEWRDRRLSTFGRRNGLVVYEKDGTPSHLIRFGSEVGMQLGLEAIAKYLDKEGGK